jgi:hypothetical protein
VTDTSREVLQQALDVLEGLFGEYGGVAVWALGGSYQPQEAIKAIRAELAKPGPEVVAWLVYAGICDMKPLYPPCKTREDAEHYAKMIKSVTEIRPLYALPLQRLIQRLNDPALRQW